jgi:hypothetical protein
MGDYHFVYKDVEGASTQWDDIQRKLGNLPEKPPAFKPPPFTPASDQDSIPKDKSFIDSKTEEELEFLEDDLDLDDDRFLQEYRSLFYQFIRLSFSCCFCLGFQIIEKTNYMHWDLGFLYAEWVIRTRRFYLFMFFFLLKDRRLAKDLLLLLSECVCKLSCFWFF